MMSKNKSSIIVNLKRKITNETAAIPPAMLAATFADVECPDDLCRLADGNQFQHLL
jgi:hypothetical protein